MDPCQLYLAEQGLAHSGFPAHAGMDPSGRALPAGFPRPMDLGCTAPRLLSGGFPRPRGDGPWIPTCGEARRWSMTVSPPTRGWTRIARRHRGFPAQWTHSRFLSHHGFPAHAGMDPGIARGPVDDLSGFPAHAGMDPGRKGPEKRTKFGFPAHAGMDPPAMNYAHGCRWGFPRPRGDGPNPRPEEGTYFKVSPPTRGWTPRQGDHRCVAHGFPAHAGMDPCGYADLLATRSPGFPAHAGMDPHGAPPAAQAPGFPRPRGDGPLYDARDRTLAQVSPPTRGWTVLL